MADSTLRLVIKANGTLLIPTSVDLESEGNDYGLRRLDDWAEVTASGTSFDIDSAGNYSHTFTEPADNLSYDFRAKIVFEGTTYFVGETIKSGTSQITAIISSTAHYTSQAEVYRMIGSFAGDLLLEDQQATSVTWDDMLEDIDETIQMYVHQHYDTSLLSSSNWVRRRATVLGANILSQRRGNNPLYLTRTERTYEELNMIRDGRMHIPGAIPRARFAPVVRNYTIQNRFFNHPMRIDTTKSTGATYSGQDTALHPFIFSFGW